MLANMYDYKTWQMAQILQLPPAVGIHSYTLHICRRRVISDDIFCQDPINSSLLQLQIAHMHYAHNLVHAI